MIALATGAAVVLAGGGESFWLYLPAALLACALSRTRASAAISTTAVIGSAAVPSVGWLSVRPIPSPLLALAVVAASVTVLIAVRERLEHERDRLRDVALTDPLTGIANRRLLLSRAEYEVARHARGRRRFALVMLDLDGFKALNDRFGHTAGDELLCDVATALTNAIRAQDTIARIGGDEFCVLAPETDARGTLRLVTRITQTVLDATAGVQTLRASVGIAVFPDDGANPTTLLDTADQRLLSAKRERGRSRRAA
jgi:diguanylate cyclase (GGDEF)-like protein